MVWPARSRRSRQKKGGAEAPPKFREETSKMRPAMGGPQVHVMATGSAASSTYFAMHKMTG